MTIKTACMYMTLILCILMNKEKINNITIGFAEAEEPQVI